MGVGCSDVVVDVVVIVIVVVGSGTAVEEIKMCFKSVYNCSRTFTGNIGFYLCCYYPTDLLIRFL